MRMGRNKIYSPEDYASLKAAYQHALTLDNPTKREDVRKKISLASQGKIISNETREKISKAGRGRKCSAETRRKLSESNKGKHSHKLSKETRQKMSKDRLGKPKSDLHKLHISQSLSGRKLSEEHKKHLSESRKQSIYRGKNSPRAKRVQCIETLQIFDTIQEACI